MTVSYVAVMCELLCRVCVIYTKRDCFCVFIFFFQAEDGIRDKLVTGVQTCALPISEDVVGPIGNEMVQNYMDYKSSRKEWESAYTSGQIGRASCRERV